MRLLQLLITLFLVPGLLSGQALSETQQLLRNHPAPEWFKDAKLGVFIHWGPYTVPAWSPRGVYAEWYQFWLENKTVFGQGTYTGREVVDFHAKKYGGSTSYYDLATQLKVELFDPKAWAKLFADAGAKYVVLTSKHHDGYALWPSAQANDRGFPWNSTAVGPGRDLVGELNSAIRQTGLKFGLYYSLYEWFHPWWLSDKPRFVREHMQPQLKDLVTRYQPDILWNDGDWELTPEEWGSAELLRWLYQDSPVKNTIITNDRWGKGLMKNFGGFLTSEYESALNTDQYWEECRGIGHSFGYNRAEDLNDYMTDEALVLTLVDVVSQGGNLLLNIGPSADGKIPVIMQQRLKYLGDWLRINGEAIYGTRRWRQPVQWSSGKLPSTEYRKKGPNYILEETTPAIERAAKEVFFTSKPQVVFAIFPRIPQGKFIIRDFPDVENLTAQLLGEHHPITVKRLEKNHLELDFTETKPGSGPVVIKLNYSKAPPGVPSLVVDIDTAFQRAKVTLQAANSSEMVFYTLDESIPNESSKLYRRPFWVDLPVTVTAVGFDQHKFSQVKTQKISLTPAKSKVVDDQPVIISSRLAGHHLTLETKPQSSLTKALTTLQDTVLAKPILTDSQWVTYMHDDAEILIDLGALRKVRGVRFAFLHQPNMGVFAPSQVQVEISDNEWDFLAKKTAPVTQPSSPGVSQYQTPIYNTIGRYIYMRIRYFKTCPAQHPMAGQPARLFIDNLIID